MKEVSFCTCNWANSCRCSWRSIKTTNLFLVIFLSFFGSHMDPKIVYFGVHMGPRVRFGTAKVVILCNTSIKNWFWEGLRFRASISYEVRSLFWFLIDVSSEMLTFDPAMHPQSHPKKALKLLKIGVEKRYSVLIPKWTVLGVHFAAKEGPKIELSALSLTVCITLKT